MMKNASYLTLAMMLMTGCETNPTQRTNWENDCQRNYSENSRDFAACKARMENMQSNNSTKKFAKEAGTVGVNPENADLPATDETRKSHDVGN